VRRGKITGVILPITLAVGVLFPQQAGSRTDEKLNYDDSEGYVVLSLLLARDASKTTKMHIYFRTVSSMPLNECKSIPREFTAALKDFHEREKSPLQLLKHFRIDGEYELIEKVDRPELPPPAPGEQDFPSDWFNQPTLVSVSAVGFDQPRTHAVAYVGGFSGPEAAGGEYYLLTRSENGWKEIKYSPVCAWSY
jgi:hypothetical protein